MLCPKCGSGIPLYLRYCPNCNYDSTLKGNSDNTLKKEDVSTFVDPKLVGFKGWLAFLGLGVFFSPFAYLYTILSDISFFQSENGMQLLHIPYYGTSLIVVEVLYAILLVATINCARLFFLKKKSFVKFFEFVVCLNILIILLASFIPYTTVYCFVNKDVMLKDFFSTEQVSAIVRTGVYACIWIPYVRYSKRVKATFTRL